MSNVIVEFNVEATMRDGVILRSNVYRPSEGGLYPVLLTRLPYGKDTYNICSLVDPVRLAASGYIVVIQDCRGRYASEGEFGGFESFEHELADGYDSVQWASELPQSSGEVGMFGTSYYGFTQWAAAAMKPPALKAIVPVFTFDSQWNGASVQGGAFDWGKTALWYLQDIAPNALSRLRSNTSDFQTELANLFAESERLSTKGYWELPLSEFTALKKLGVTPQFFEQFEHPAYDEYWQKLSLIPYYDGITVPSVNVGGWYDLFVQNTINNYQQMKKRGIRTHLLVGPWSHVKRSSYVGDVNFGLTAGADFLNGEEDFTSLHLRWFDHFLKGEETSFADEAPVKIFVMGENKWRCESDWPLTQTTYKRLYFHSDGQAAENHGTASLSYEPPGDEPADSYIYDPSDPVPTVGGSTLLHMDFPPGPRDQRAIDNRPDVLVYTSDVLTENIEVTGPIKARLWVSSSALDTDFVVRLTDVHPDGKSLCLCDGILRMRFRDSWSDPKLMNPGEVYEVEVDCSVTSNLFKVGHRIRVQVTSSSFPRWNRNLNTGESNECSTRYCSAKQFFYHDANRPSHLLLPVIPC